jgi:SAM-dependent methyltransferase
MLSALIDDGVPDEWPARRGAWLVPRPARRWLRVAPRRLAGRVRHHGRQVQCPCCGAQYRDFAPFRGADRVCWRCGSLERDRLLWLVFDRDPSLLAPGMRLLHIAPEESLRPRLRRVAGVYVCGDLTGTFGDEIIDITDLPYPDDSFDAVICNHVLEHVPDDRTAMRQLRRVLAPGGWAILLVPDVEGEHTLEDPSAVDPADRLRLYGQEDHVRRYGRDYVDRLAAAGFTPRAIDMTGQLSAYEIARHRLQKFHAVEPIFLCR